ncbi:hypothetical protein ABKN59_002089 [Abortiporus biennis]
MSSLDEHVDRLSQLATSIRARTSASQEAYSSSSIGPYTRAVLETPLGDLIRDIDPAELGLFTLVEPSQPGPSQAAAQEEDIFTARAEIARAEFTGATPLKRPPTARPGKDDPLRPREHEPEIYAQAALKYLDRYDSIRPMPRAVEQAENILERLVAVRENINNLNEMLHQLSSDDPNERPRSPKSMVKEEETRIREIQSDIADLKKRKEAFLKKKSTGVRSTNKLASRFKPPPPPTSPDDQEHSFWNTPAAAARTLHFGDDDLLTDEQLDFSNMSAFASPTPETKSTRFTSLKSKFGDRTGSRGTHMAFIEPQEMPRSGRNVVEVEDSFDLSHHDLNEEDDDGDDEDKTIKVGKPIVPELSPSPPPVEEEKEIQEPESPSPAPPNHSDAVKKQRYKITTELENIVSKIWATVGEIIMPGHPFDISSSSSGNRPPRAKETIAHLQSLSSQALSPTSPTASSHSSLSTLNPPTQTTSQQVLTAHVLLALLSSPPTYSMSLNKLKEILLEKSGAERGGIGGRAVGTGTAVTRPIYGCVAKRLLKIERGGREQVVMFDI